MNDESPIDFSKHVLTVKHNDGLYRHLRCQKPGTWIYGFDVTTWPGHLAITGDIGSYLFARVPDMLTFFESSKGGINPDYWGQKLQGPSPGAHTQYSADRFESRVLEWYDDVAAGLHVEEHRHELRRQLDEQVLRRIHDVEYEARTLLADFEWNGFRLDEYHEWNLREYRPDFIGCCWAIVWAIEQYRRRPRVQIQTITPPKSPLGACTPGFGGSAASGAIAQAVANDRNRVMES